MQTLSLIPLPQQVRRTEGVWRTSDPRGEATAELDPLLPADTYRVSVTTSGAALTGGSLQALAWARQTLGQLATCAEDDMPCVEIEDRPEYAWRGLMVDVARHVMPMSFLLQLVDAMELHRLNVLHLHLTDDQGWRVEIDAYPRLTEVGAWRERTMRGRKAPGPLDEHAVEYDEDRHGGFYTKAELRDLVAYAAGRGVTVVPEIDLPGHMQAAVAAYPALGNRPDASVPVREEWGISDDVLNVEDATVEFVRTVLREVMEVFPGDFVHLGGDECPTTQWSVSAAARRRMDELGLSDVDQLQGWFTAQVASVLDDAGRRLVAWDEAAERGCPPDAVIMAWQSAVHARAAAASGYDVVMASREAFYFDYYQGPQSQEPLAFDAETPLRTVFDAEVRPVGWSAEEQARVVGAQCQVWTEYIPTPDHLAYMLFPRMCAFAERAWGSPRTSYENFIGRLGQHLPRISALGLGFRSLDGAGPGVVAGGTSTPAPSVPQ